MKPLYEMDAQEQTDYAEQMLAGFYPADKLKEFMPLIRSINELKKAKGALILGHNYMRPEVFWGVSDYVGDSLALARKSTQVHPKMILFNGVYFMAESAKILNPQAKVLIADSNAGCSLVDGMSKQQLMQLKESHPGVPVVCYINSSAEVKAESDVVCTSANAVQVVNALDHKQIIFVPDQYLAANVAQHTDKEIIPFEGSCEVHRQFTREHVLSQRQKEPALVTLAHPECPVEVTSEVDIVGSTSKMVQWNEGGPETDHAFIATEGSMVENIQVERPELNMHGPKFYCPHMQLITLAKVLEALEQERIEVNVNPEVRQGALNSLERMLELVA